MKGKKRTSPYRKKIIEISHYQLSHAHSTQLFKESFEKAVEHVGSKELPERLPRSLMKGSVPRNSCLAQWRRIIKIYSCVLIQGSS